MSVLTHRRIGSQWRDRTGLHRFPSRRRRWSAQPIGGAGRRVDRGSPGSVASWRIAGQGSVEMLRRAAAVAAALAVLVPAAPAQARAFGVRLVAGAGQGEHGETLDEAGCTTWAVSRRWRPVPGSGWRWSIPGWMPIIRSSPVPSPWAGTCCTAIPTPGRTAWGTAPGWPASSPPARSPVPFHGLAPGVTVVPVRITEKEQIGGEETGDDGTPQEFAEADRLGGRPGPGQRRRDQPLGGDDRGQRAGAPGGRGRGGGRCGGGRRGR